MCYVKNIDPNLVTEIKNYNKKQTKMVYSANYQGRKVFIKKFNISDKSYNRELATSRLVQKDSRFPTLIGTYIVAKKKYLVFEWIKHSDTLEDCVTDVKKFMKIKPHFDHIIPRLFSLVTALHNYGIFHGDLKAKNILVSKNYDNIFLIDFDYSKPLERENKIDDYMNLCIIILQLTLPAQSLPIKKSRKYIDFINIKDRNLQSVINLITGDFSKLFDKLTIT